MAGFIRALSVLAYALGVPLACTDRVADAHGICR